MTLVKTSTADSLAWIGPDLLVRLLPFALLVTVIWVVGRPAWLGLDAGQLDAQLGFGLPACMAFFATACLLQRAMTPRRGSLRVPGSTLDMALQGGFFLLNAALEEAFFRGLLQGGLGTVVDPALGALVGTTLYVLYHRLGGWPWMDVAATALIGVPVALAFGLLPGPPSLLGVTLAHFGATSGFLGPGPWLLRRLHLLRH